MAHINLAAAIQSVYTELHTAMTTIEVQSGLNLRYDSVEVEFVVEMGESDELGGGAKFWVVEANGKKATDQRVTHTIRIKLTPLATPDSPLRAPSMAFLSACETATSGRLPDEALAASQALLTTGVPGVVDGIWGGGGQGSTP